MSDSEEYGSEESYEFEFEDDDVSDQASEMKQDEEEEELQNEYYKAKSLKDEDTQIALDKLDKLAESEIMPESALWVYKSRKQVAKIHFASHQLNLCLENLQKLQVSISAIDDKQYIDESLNRILTKYGSVKDDVFRLSLYEIVLELIRSAGGRPTNDRLWIRACLNQFFILLKQRQLDRCASLIAQLNSKLQSVSEITRTSYTLEVIAGEIELLSLYKDVDWKRLDYLYKKSLTIVSPVTHPRIVGVIKECGGKLSFRKGQYELSRSNFYDSFKSFDECGSTEKDRSFKYLILLSLITDNEFNPFESQETQHYAQEPDFKKLTLMIECYNELDMDGFESVFDRLEDEDDFYKDELFVASVKIVKSLITEKILQNYFKSYSRLTFDFIMDTLHLKEDVLKKMLVRMGAQGKLHNVRVDFIDRVIATVSGSQSKKLVLPPPDITAAQVLTNLKCFGDSKLRPTSTSTDDNMSVEPESDHSHSRDNDTTGGEDELEHSVDLLNVSEAANKEGTSSSDYFCRTLLGTRNTSKSSGRIESVKSTLKILKTSVPPPYTSGLSTKDQIFTEQRLGSTNPEILNRLQNNDSEGCDPGEKLRYYDLWAKQLITNLTSTELMNHRSE